MIKNGRILLLVFTGVLWLAAQDSFAQLLEDRNKLKTAEKKYFKPIINLNRNTKKKTNKSPKIERPLPVKYSKVHKPKLYAVNPRYSRPHKIEKFHKPANERGFVTSFTIYGGKPPRHPQGPGATSLSPPIAAKKSLKSDSKQKSSYTFKTKRQKKGKDMHPSANYLAVKGNDSKFVRDNMRKFNVKWVRMNGNKVQPKSVKQKPKKLKFDKDEREIWNN